jgi:hypothetical protein
LEERAQGLGDRFGLGMQPAGGQPDDAVAGELQCGVAGAVALERKAGGAVVGVSRRRRALAPPSGSSSNSGGVKPAARTLVAGGGRA